MPTDEPGLISFPIEPVNGVYANTPPSQMPLGAAVEMINLYIHGDTIRKRPGYSPLGNQISSTKRVMGVFSTTDDEDTSFLFAATETGLYRYDPGAGTWTVYTGPALTGGSERIFVWDVSQNSVVFCQGVDQVMRVPFTGTNYAILNANCPAAKFLTRFADRLYIAFTVEAGSTKPFRVRRSVNGDHTDWVGLGSGFNDLAEYPYHIKGLTKHGAQLLVAAEEALWIATRTGVSASPARFDPSVPGSGVYASHTLRTRVNDHLYMGRDQFYVFNGSVSSEVGDAIRDEVFFNLEASKVHMDFSIIRPTNQEWIVFICETGQTTPHVAWVWNWHHNAWYKWTFSGPICGTVHRQDVVRTWNSLVGDWNQQNWEWTSSTGTANFPLMLTGNSDGRVYQWKEDYSSDNGVEIPCRWVSKDFSASLLVAMGMATPQYSMKMLLLRGLVVEYVAAESEATLHFYLSQDKGRTWNGPYDVTLDAGGGQAVLTEKISGPTIRWKFEHSSTSEQFRIARFVPMFEILGEDILSTV